MDLGLKDHVVLVVGGTGLIGRAVVDATRSEGAAVLAGSRSGDGDITLDARDPASVSRAVTSILRDHGRIDGVVVAAAPSARTLDPAANADPDAVLEAIEAKAIAFLRVAQAVLPAMRERGYGRIIGVSGQNAWLTGNVRGSVRNASLIVAAKNLADTVAGQGITVNVVNPATVTEEPSSQVAPGRGGDSSPRDVAALVTFLLSPNAAAISGESIAVGHRVHGVTVF